MWKEPKTLAMLILDGKMVAEERKAQMKSEIEQFLKQGKRAPRLAVVMVGNDPASRSYVRNKHKACKQVGIESIDINFDESVSQLELERVIRELNSDPEIDAMIIQLPLPKHLDSDRLVDMILPQKDGDGFHPVNLGRMLQGRPAMLPATPKGIIELMKYYRINPQGKHVVILGRSNIVGKPLAAMLVQKQQWANATVTLCHSKTPNLLDFTRSADILIVAMGKPMFIKADMVKPGAVIIDVGINAVEDKTRKSGYRLVGDVDFEDVKRVVSAITPVPGGVGQMTVVSLLENTLIAYKKEIYQ